MFKTYTAGALAKVEKKRALNEATLRDFLREMLLIRRFEEKVEERFRAGDLPGFLHVAIGQEAVAVGVCRRWRTATPSPPPTARTGTRSPAGRPRTR
jgi:TPP-dependent pyruvate/acetoin dehydrogenase alpha subunit